jgi:hypothetical protein
MNKTVINTFTEGLNKDVSKQVMSNKAYLDAQNFRIITTEGSTTGTLENIKGNKKISDIKIADGQMIIGSCEIRDKIILFTTNNTGGIITVADSVTSDNAIITVDSMTPTVDNTISLDSRSMIYELVIDLETETQESLTVLYDDNLSIDTSFLNFTTFYPIKTVGRYETPNVQKVYWTDGYNNMRYINIAINQTETGSAHVNAVRDYMGVNKFEFLPNFIPSTPKLKNITSGTLMTGMVQYAYQLYRLNGAETAMSPVSALIHIVTDSDFKSNSKFYKGDELSVLSGKGCKLEINNLNDGYNRLRLIRIFYSTLNGIPVISVAAEIEISTTHGKVQVTDSGDTLTTMTVDEFNIYSTELFKCADLATKDNRLFAANIGKSDFIVDDFDVRAVRFRVPEEFEIHPSATVVDGVIPLVIDNNLTNWSAYVSDHDGINEFNDSDNDGIASHMFKYQSNGTTLGAEGPNVLIDFETAPITIDAAGSWIASQKTFYEGIGSDGYDTSYTGYASPWKGDKLSWQRDEVYRLAVIWGNDRGQISDPKWIIDLRMPSLHDPTFLDSGGDAENDQQFPWLEAAVSGSTVVSYRLFPRIYFKKFPTNATWAQIYRVKRERNDRSVLTQAIGIHSVTLAGYDVADAFTSYTNTYQPKLFGGPDFVHTDNGLLIKLVSPEINILKNIKSNSANDYLDYVTRYEYPSNVQYQSYVSAGGAWIIRTHKGVENTRVPYAVNNRTTINEVAFATPTESISDGTVSVSGPSTLDFVKINNKEYCNYNVQSRSDPGGPFENYKLGCSGLVVSYDNTNWVAEDIGYPIINYKQNVTTSRYGGITYEDRSLNKYIPCSDVILLNQVNTWIDIARGDTFITYFDVSTLLYDLHVGLWDRQTMSESAFIPLESSINTDLRYDESQSHISSSPYQTAMRQETAGAHEYLSDPTYTYVQDKDLYLYNTVYSQDTNVQVATALPIDFQPETKFDCMIKASNPKINGELKDSWTKFGINEFIEVDSKYGPVNALLAFNNMLYYWQDGGFGVVSVNERSLVTDDNSSQIVLGTGGILSRYDYISNDVGCKDKFSITSSINGLYWYDRLVKSIYKFSKGLENLTRSKYMQSYMDIVENAHISLSHANTNDNEVLFTFHNDNDGFTLSFSELVDAFISFYSFIPTIYIPFKHRYLTTTSLSFSPNGTFNNNYLFLHESDIIPRCNFYAVNTDISFAYVDSSMELLFNPDFISTKVFDNLFFVANSFAGSTELYGETFDSIQFYNDFQNTGKIVLALKTNLERRERGWTMAIPRSIVNVSVTLNPDKFTEVNSTQLFKERMRDKYLIAYLVYVNDGTADKFVVSHVGLTYRNSIR